MKDKTRVFSGREISSEDIEMIRWIRKTYPKLMRSELAGTVCEFIGWNTPSGRAKVPQCLECLAKLEEEGLITLPPLRLREKKKETNKATIEIDTTEISVCDMTSIEIEIVRPGKELARWREYVSRYHMLGDKKVFGSRLQYFIKSNDKELGCLQFSASSWALSEREKWIGWTAEERKERLNLIVNNSRYLIFPWVNIKNLASKALSVAIKQIQTDWLREYCYAPVLLETFVDKSHFKGTCYKAANWICLGETKGRGRIDRAHENAETIKEIYVYPLQKDFREILKGEKPCKVVTPE